ncbi:component of IIS longevity pathway SMK-1-domain-containing protein [Pisolithus marmoratus]|nr:component of IIS longevity pathway SMK-1-domain-containing protein [Pisolithus marmoratus]
MSRTDQETPTFNSDDNTVDILQHDSLSAAPHDLLIAAANTAALELDLPEPDAVLNPPPTNPLSLGDSRDLLFADIAHVGDHVKGDHISMAETADPASDSQQSPESSQELKRVKVYELIGSRWVDQGTAYCFGQLDESNQAFLIARSEADFDKIILSTAIRSNDVYQRQQDSLIVWTEPDGADYALSFQDADGCAEVWNFIIEVQRHLNADQGLGSSSPAGDHSATTATIIRTGHLPSPQLGNIQDIEGAIKALARTQTIKERICEYIQREGYIKALIDVMSMAEDLESLDNLHALCSLMQTILMMNDHSVYEHILEDDIFFGVVGMLEYDPEFPTHKANYRDFLHNNTRFHQPIKVHHTFRLQFLKDVVLARILDDSTFNVLNSCIIFNQIDIINHVQQDPVFLQEIVRLYVSEEVLAGPRKDGEETDAAGTPNGIVANGRHPPQTTPFSFDPPGPLTESDIAFRREVVLLIQQLCVMGKNVQLPARMALFRTLVDRGILFAVQWGFGLNERENTSKVVINAASEIMSALLDHDLHGVRGHVFKQAMAVEREKEAGRIGADKAETLLKLMCRIITQSRDLAVQCQIGDALKALLDVSQNTIGPGTTPSALGAKFSARPKDDPGTEKFLDYFYKNCIEVLFKPYGDIPDFRKQTDAEPILKLSREKTNLFLYLCDLMCIFAQQHTFRSHFYMLSSNISTRVAILLSARDKHLRLSAFRFFRICLKLNNKNLFNHLTKLDVFKPILDLALQESHRDSLLSASCQEFFEHMRKENMKDLINHCMTKHEAIVRQLATTPTEGARFNAFIRRWEINIEPPPKEGSQPDQDTRDSRRMVRAIDAEEENYFNNDDDDSDQPPPFISSSSLGPRSSVALGSLRRKRRGALVTSKISLRPQNFALPRTPQLSALVDYDDEDEDAERAQDSVVTSPRESPPLSGSDIPPSPRLAHRQISRPSNIPRLRSQEEDEHLLESITRTKVVTTPMSADAGTSPKSPLQFPRMGEKRRREDDDEEELLERLASKPKRVDLGTHKDDDAASGRVKPPAKQGDDPPKRIKVMLRPSSIAITQQPSSLVSSEASAKDGDTG